MLDEQGRPIEGRGETEGRSEATEHMFTPWQAWALGRMLRVLRERADLRAILHGIGIAWGLVVISDALRARVGHVGSFPMTVGRWIAW